MMLDGLAFSKGEVVLLLLVICVALSSSQGQESNTTLTVNASSYNNLLCPEVAQWTCNVTTNSIAHIEITNTTNNSILLFNPTQRNSLNFINEYSQRDKGTYAISTLTVDSEELVIRGYYLLTCYSSSVDIVQYSLMLDIEEPKSPSILSLSFYINKSALAIGYEMTVSSKIYNYSYCKYRKNSYIITSLLTDKDDKPILTTNTMLNSSNCNDSLCTIRNTFSETLLSRFSFLLLESANKFAQSPPLQYNLTLLNGFNFTLTSKDCGLIALCSSSVPLLNNICIINYKRTNEHTEIVAHIPANKMFLFNLSHDTTYQMNITFETGNERVHLQKILKTSKRCSESTSSTNQQFLMIIISACILLVALLFCGAGCFICVFISCRSKKSTNDGRSTEAEKINSELPVSLSLHEELKLSKEFDPCDGHKSFNIVNSDSFESGSDNVIPTVQVRHRLDPYGNTGSYDTLEKDTVEMESLEMREQQIKENHCFDESTNLPDAIKPPFFYSSLKNSDQANRRGNEVDITKPPFNYDKLDSPLKGHHQTDYDPATVHLEMDNTMPNMDPNLKMEEHMYESVDL